MRALATGVILAYAGILVVGGLIGWSRALILRA